MAYISRLGKRLYCWAAWSAVAYASTLIALVVARHVLDARHGLLGLAAVFEPYLFLPALALVPPALRRGARSARLALAATALLWAALYVPPLLARPVQAAPAGPEVRVASWNIYAGNAQLDDVVAALRAGAADVVCLQEFSHAEHAAIAGDAVLAARYPYRILRPREGTLGMALLSAYPILEQDTLDDLLVIWARLDLGAGRTLRVVDVHPLPAGLRMLRVGPIKFPGGYEPGRRDEQIARMRALIDPWLAAGEPLLFAGDFNVTEREPGYREASAGLLDAQRIAGNGLGNTWQPVIADALPQVPVLRIDYLFSTPALVPQRLSVDCTPRGSDHCALEATFALAR